MHDVLLVVASSLACAVEMVEALTIVLAVGVTRGWRSALIGSGVALLALSVVVAALGPALAHLPINSMRLAVGVLLTVFGLQWLRKAVLRSSGHKALHDEDAIYAKERDAALAAGGRSPGVDWYTFTVAFKGVFLEGLEVAFIVVTFGGAQHAVGLVAAGAGAAAVVVLLVGLAIHRPLSRVPENTMKFVVGAMLTSFGMFWAGEGAGISWPGHDAALLALLAYVAVASLLLTNVLRRRTELIAPQPTGGLA
ncbi:MAG: hypothetical protein JWM05_2761 [Acidimicrobiales bacterium]|nr:hypothetical protein [Acidimicrobiales bacterium]